MEGKILEKYLIDSTYLYRKFGTVYLSAVKDYVISEIIVRFMNGNMQLDLSLYAASWIIELQNEQKVMAYSHQGVRYTAKAFAIANVKIILYYFDELRL